MEEIKALCKGVVPVGSRVTCDPSPTNTDEDFLCLVDRERFLELIQLLVYEGYEVGGSDITPSENFTVDKFEGFQSYRKGDVNLIVTCSNVFFDLFMLATNIAKQKNLLVKEDRISLFQHIIYGKV